MDMPKPTTDKCHSGGCMAWHHWPNDSPEFHPGLEDILSQHHGGKHHREGDPPVHVLHQLSGVRGA